MNKENPFWSSAIFSFLRIIVKANKLSQIVEYSRNPWLTEKTPGFKVRMDSVLHEECDIKESVGSEFKIDASYLSPNVNFVASL